jgi:hypothetical protein
MQESVVIQAECKPTCPTAVSPSPSGLSQFYLHPGQTQESVPGINSIMSEESGKKSGCQTNKIRTSEALCVWDHSPLHILQES